MISKVKKLLSHLLMMICLGSLPLHQTEAQVCGHIASPEDEARLLANKEVMYDIVQQRTMTSYIPIKFHLVARSDGTGRIAESELFEQLCVVNEQYAEQDIQFYMNEGFGYINNSAVYENPQSQDFVMDIARDRNAINVYCVNNAGGGAGVVTLGYYDPRNDWVVMANGATRAAESEFAHELGHFFSLLHPHNGWDCDQYNEADHGNPVNLSTAPCHNRAVELQDRSNCDNSGDFLCDTPPDYLFGLGWPNCNYTNEVQDPNGDVVDPDETNYMGYFLQCPVDAYTWSDQQILAIRADYESGARNYLRRSPPESVEIVTDRAVLISPADGEVVDDHDEALLTWEEVPNASMYLVEVDELPSFSFALRSFIVDEESLRLTDLEENKNYFWRVRGFTDVSTCASPSVRNRFRTGLMTATQDLSEDLEISLFPNPVLPGSGAMITVKSGVNIISADVRTLSGTTVQSLSGNGNRLSIPSGTMAQGIYIVEIQTDQGAAIQKLIQL